MPTKVISFRSPIEIYELLQKSAKKDGKNLNRHLLEICIDEIENRHLLRAEKIVDDFANLLIGRLEHMNKAIFEADEIKLIVENILHTFCEDRLSSLMKVLKSFDQKRINYDLIKLTYHKNKKQNDLNTI